MFVSTNPTGQWNALTGNFWVNTPESVTTRDPVTGNNILIETPFGAGSPFVFSSDLQQAAQRNWRPALNGGTLIGLEFVCNVSPSFSTDPDFVSSGDNKVVVFGEEEGHELYDPDDFTAGHAIALTQEEPEQSGRYFIGTSRQLHLETGDEHDGIVVFLEAEAVWCWLGYRFFDKTAQGETCWALFTCEFRPRIVPFEPNYGWIEATTPYRLPRYLSNWLVTGVPSLKEDWDIPAGHIHDGIQINPIVGGPPFGEYAVGPDYALNVEFAFETALDPRASAGAVIFRGFHDDPDNSRRSILNIISGSRIFFPSTYRSHDE